MDHVTWYDMVRCEVILYIVTLYAATCYAHHAGMRHDVLQHAAITSRLCTVYYVMQGHCVWCVTCPRCPWERCNAAKLQRWQSWSWICPTLSRVLHVWSKKVGSRTDQYTYMRAPLVKSNITISNTWYNHIQENTRAPLVLQLLRPMLRCFMGI